MTMIPIYPFLHYGCPRDNYHNATIFYMSETFALLFLGRTFEVLPVLEVLCYLTFVNCCGGFYDLSLFLMVASICRDSADTQYMLIQTNFSKSPKQLTYKLL